MGQILRFAILLVIADITMVNFRVQARGMSSVAWAFEANDLVPDVIPRAPCAAVAVNYRSGAQVNFGNELTPTQVKDIPIVRWNACPHSFYTLALVDPDAPCRADPKFREFHHWLVGNIPGDNIYMGETLTAYVGSGPPPGAGLHRYVFLVYKQPGRLTFHEPRIPNNSGEDRGGFSIAKFARKYNLGNPIAGNFYQAQYDEYVPILYKQLGIVKYVSGVQVNLGNELTPTQVKDIPTVTWEASPDCYYNLALTDPDAPSRADPTSREFDHWLVGNILGDNILSGETLSAYVGSGPGLGTGFNRYVFLVYKQPGELTFDEPRVTNTSSKNRSGFSIADFAEKYGLREPIAGNFYQAQYDDYVPILYEQLGI